MVRKFKIVFLSVVLTLAFSKSSYSFMGVIDPTAIAKAAEQLSEAKKSVANQVEQINKMKEQITIFNDVKKLNTELNQAIGAIARIKLPITSIDRLASQLRKDTACLFPKMPSYGIDFAEMDSSLCNWTAIYATNFFTTKDFSKMSLEEKIEETKRVDDRWRNYSTDTVVRAMALSDLSQRTAEETSKTADQLQNALDSSEDVQDRVHVQAQVQIAQLRATAQQTQLLAQMLKVQTALAHRLGMSVDVRPSQELEDEISKWGAD